MKAGFLPNDFMIEVTFSDAAAVTDTLPAIWPLLRCNVSINYSSELIQQILAVSQNSARPCISFFMTKFSSGKEKSVLSEPCASNVPEKCFVCESAD